MMVLSQSGTIDSAVTNGTSHVVNLLDVTLTLCVSHLRRLKLWYMESVVTKQSAHAIQHFVLLYPNQSVKRLAKFMTLLTQLHVAKSGFVNVLQKRNAHPWKN